MPVLSDLVVEDGSGRLDANSYVSIADADTYHSLRGNTIWAAATDSDKVVALVRATEYLDARWTFTGDPFKATQALVFPRESEYLDRNGDDVSESVPVAIANATLEYALAVLGDGTSLVSLSPAIDQTEPWSVTYQRDQVGTLETETHYDTDKGIKVTKAYPTADRIIKASGFLVTRGGTIR